MSNIQKHNHGIAEVKLKDKLGKLSISSKGKDSALAKVELPRLFYQLVIFVVDGSGSMYGSGKTGKTKGEEVAGIIKPVVDRLKNSKNYNCFDVSTFVYAKEFEMVLNSIPVKNIGNDISFNPNDYKVGIATYIADCLQSVGEHAESYLDTHKGKNAQVLIIVISDGAISDIEKAKPIAESIMQHSKIIISSAFLETEGITKDVLEECQNRMIKITSTSKLEVNHFFTSTVDPEIIRKHMIKSISTVSKID